MKISIFAHQALTTTDNAAEIIEIDTDDDHADETFDQLQQDDYQVDAWYGSKGQNQEGDKS